MAIQDPYRVAWGVDPASIEAIDPAFQKLSQGGFNLAQSFQFGAQDPAYQQAMLESAQKYGMQLMPYIYPQRSQTYAGLIPEEQIQALSPYAENPALWGYQLFEEPGGAWDLGAKDMTAEAQVARYQQMKGLWPDLQYSTSLGATAWPNPDVWSPESFDAAFHTWYAGGGDISDLTDYMARDPNRQKLLQQATEMGKTVTPILRASARPGETDYPWENMAPFSEQLGAFQNIVPGSTGASFYNMENYLSDLNNLPYWDQITALNQMLGGGAISPESTPEPTPEPTPPTLPTGEPGGEWPTAPTTGGDTMAQSWWPDFNKIYGESVAGTREFPEDWRTFQWEPDYYPPATGAGGLPMPTSPTYRPFGYAPPGVTTPTGYEGPTAPGTFYNPLQTPQYPTYESMGTPESFYQPYGGTYPTYQSYDDALRQQLGTTLGERMQGIGVGPGTESIEYRRGIPDEN